MLAFPIVLSVLFILSVFMRVGLEYHEQTEDDNNFD